MAFKFFICMSIIAHFIYSLKCLKQENTRKNKVSAIAALFLLFFGMFMMLDTWI